VAQGQSAQVAQPAQSGQVGQTGQAGQPAVSPVTVNISPDLLRLAGLGQQVGQVGQSGQQPAQSAQPGQPGQETPKPATQSAQPGQTTQQPAQQPAPDVAALQAQLSALQAQHRAALIRAEVERVAIVGGAHSTADVLKLVADELDVAADGRVIAKGDPRTTGEQHVARFLAARPHMLKPVVAAGGAGAGAVATPPSAQAPPKADMSSNENATRLARMIAERRGYLQSKPGPSGQAA